ncbi:Heat shock cognate 70 kDa protein [Taenia solium]|eukprot:TsM_001240300 transcript=TsM_001240300 gene=TsM_001240300
MKLGEEKESSRMAARTILEDYVRSIRSKMGENKTKERVPEAFRCNMLKMCKTTTKWMDTDQQATKEKYELMYINLEARNNSIILTKNFSS